MLNLLDQVIRAVLDTGWTASGAPAKPGFYFTPPDADWRQKVKQGTEERLNIYLYEVRENTDFRRSGRDIIERNGIYERSSPPTYLDVQYLLSAWSPAEDAEATTPVLDEHRLLAEALRVLLRNPDVRPGALGIAGGGPVFQQAHVFLSLGAPETPRVLNDFWSTMKLPWRPAILLTATAPLDLLQDEAVGPPVVTLVQRTLLIGTSAVEERVLIGGRVLRAADDAPVVGASVRRIETGEEAPTDGQGRFSFGGLRRGTHRLRVSAPGLTPIERDLDVPDGPSDQHTFRLS
jgi:hypothetical protein